jgi:hypothetical protein
VLLWSVDAGLCGKFLDSTPAPPLAQLPSDDVKSDADEEAELIMPETVKFHQVFRKEIYLVRVKVFPFLFYFDEKF